MVSFTIQVHFFLLLYLILQEGYLVYECNSMCNCDRACQNRILQNGVQIRLEIFRTEKKVIWQVYSFCSLLTWLIVKTVDLKGWAVRAGQKIGRGAFVCEVIGEVLNDQEADEQGKRFVRVLDVICIHKFYCYI